MEDLKVSIQVEFTYTLNIEIKGLKQKLYDSL